MADDPKTDWMAPGEPDPPSVNSEWAPLQGPTIDGVAIKEVRPVVATDGCLTEVWRRDWDMGPGTVDQVFQRILDPGAINGWHAHASTTDRLFCAHGRIRLSLYDGRKSSPTFGYDWHRVLGAERPLLVVVPPGVWHAVTTLGPSPALVINLVDRAYDYSAPDHRRLPLDTPHIPVKLR
jgi:dTDP-4-dehydrorhamnose 3,5-epimerase